MKTLTIFTPTYNRAHTLYKVYNSLRRQTCKDFEWLIIDDGSNDNTKDLIDCWIKEGCVDIRYIYQENQGMHGAHNTAYKNIITELNTCIDSDDYMPDDAVEKILTLWKEKGNDTYAGIIGLDARMSDLSIIGKKFPDNLKETTLRDYYEIYGGSGDKKIIYRTKLIKNYPEYPIFAGEKYVSLAYKYNLIDDDGFPLITSNDVYAIVDYQLDGSSSSMWKQYWNNPHGWIFIRKYEMQHCHTLKRKFILNIHYISHSIKCKNYKFIMESPMKILTLLCLIPGVILYYINKYKVKNNRSFKLNS